VPKALEFAESFSKPVNVPGWLSKVAGAVLPAFIKRIVCREHILQV
jgi:hypothetical protein